MSPPLVGGLPPVLFGVDLPREGDLCAGGEIEVAGWALGTGSAVASVEVRVDGEASCLLPVGEVRLDVAMSVALPGAAVSGWRGRAALPADGGGEVAFVARLADGSEHPLATRRVRRVEGTSGVRLEPPVDGAVPRGLLGLRAWSAHPVRELRASVDGEVVATRRVAGEPPPWALEVGLEGIAGDRARLCVVGVDAAGEPTPLLFDATLPLRSLAPEEGWLGGIDVCCVMEGGVLLVQGWVCCRAAEVARVEISANDLPLGRAQLGAPRPDVADRLALADAPVAGFEMMEPLPERAGGELMLVVAAMNLRGERWTISRRLSSAPATVPGAAVGAGERGTAGRGRSRSAGGGRGVRRVRVYAHALSYGGAQLYLHELLRRLLPLGSLEVTFVAPADGPLRQRTEELGIAVEICGPYPRHGGDERAEWMRREGERLRAAGCDVVLVNSLGSFAPVELAQEHGLPTVWAIHESFPFEVFCALSRIEGEAREQFRAALGGVTVAVFVAEATRALLAPQVAPGRARVIRYGVDTAAIAAFTAGFDRAAFRRRHGIGEQDRVILCVARTEPRKGQARLCQAFRLLDRQPTPTHLVLLGDTGNPYAAMVREALARRPPANPVHLLPLTPDVLPWYAAADFEVLASDLESMPRSTIEAMAAGAVVAATAVFGVPELITDGVDGLLCEPNDLRSLHDLLLRLLALSPERRAAIAEAGRQRVLRHHDSAGYAAEYHRLLLALA